MIEITEDKLPDRIIETSYQEKLINGVLMFRNRSDVDWQQCSIEQMGQRIIDLENTIIDLKACLRTCANSAQGGLDQYPTRE